MAVAEELPPIELGLRDVPDPPRRRPSTTKRPTSARFSEQALSPRDRRCDLIHPHPKSSTAQRLQAMPAAAKRTFVPVATLSSGELLFDDTFNCGFGCNWYLQATSSVLEIIAMPRKEFQEVVDPAMLSELLELAYERAVSFEERLYRACVSKQAHKAEVGLERSMARNVRTGWT